MKIISIANDPDLTFIARMRFPGRFSKKKEKEKQKMIKDLPVSFVRRPCTFPYTRIGKRAGTWEPSVQRTTSFNIRLTTYNEVTDHVRG
ncbi:hypothetical protein [Mongoliibacter sp.]|uniref:hypothetical protein n=1 Tax=Mongoliibacter sp. TaxID=2022438 RepID=UPI0025DDE132|nr:hypothetical protein [Mongoliibacter sp.]